MRILGVDPGTETTGYGLIDADPSGTRLRLITYGEIAGPARRRPLPLRLATVFRGLTELILAERPEQMVVEGVFYSKNARAALTIGHVRGVALLAAAEQGLLVTEYAPAEVKIAVSGNGAARKPQVQYMVQQLLGLASVPPADAADALAIAYCHARRAPFAILRARHVATDRRAGDRALPREPNESTSPDPAPVNAKGTT